MSHPRSSAQATNRAVLDDAKFTKFHLKIAPDSTGGMFCDAHIGEAIIRVSASP